MTLPESLSNAGRFAPHSVGLRFYVWVVTGSAVLLATLLLWPLSVSRFDSNSSFYIKYDPSSGFDKQQINHLVLEAIRQQTEPYSLREILLGIEDDAELASSLLKSWDPVKIRGALRIQSRPGSLSNAIEFRCTLTGHGTADEIQFVNQMVSRTAARLSTRFTDQSARGAIVALADDFQNVQTQILDQNRELVQGVVDKLDSASNELQILTNDLIQFDQRQQQNQQDQGLNPRWAELKREKDQINGELRRLLEEQGLPRFHARVTPLLARAEDLTHRLNSVPQYDVDETRSYGSAFHVKNRFAMENPGATFGPSLANMVEDAKSIQLSEPGKQLKEIQQRLNQDRASIPTISKRLASRAESHIVNENGMSVDRIALAKRSRPIGGTPSQGHFMLIFASSVAFGSVMAWWFDPKTRRRRFYTTSQLQSRLALPIVGQFRTGPAAVEQFPLRQRLGALGVRVCEWALLGMLVTLAIAALMNSEVVLALVNNPFEAITQIVWIVAPRS